MIKPLNKSIAKTVLVIRDQICHSADSVTSPTAKHIKYEKSPWVISGIKGSTWGLCLPGQRLPSAVTVQMMFSGLSFFSLLYSPCRPNLVLSNALVCVRGDASQPVPSVPWLGRRNVPDMFIPCCGSSGSEVSVIPEAKPHWQGLQENQCCSLTKLPGQTSWFKWSDPKTRAETGITMSTPWEGVGQLFTGSCSSTGKCHWCLWHSAKTWGVLGSGDGIQLEGCNFTPSGQHRTFNPIPGGKDIGLIPWHMAL